MIVFAILSSSPCIHSLHFAISLTAKLSTVILSGGQTVCIMHDTEALQIVSDAKILRAVLFLEAWTVADLPWSTRPAAVEGNTRILSRQFHIDSTFSERKILRNHTKFLLA